MVAQLLHPARGDTGVRGFSRGQQGFLGLDIHSLVGGAAVVLGAEAGQEVLGDGVQQRLKLDLHPHLDHGFILIRIYLGVEIQRPLQTENRDTLLAGFL